jgi:hypothetical protein
VQCNRTQKFLVWNDCVVADVGMAYVGHTLAMNSMSYPSVNTRSMDRSVRRLCGQLSALGKLGTASFQTTFRKCPIREVVSAQFRRNGVGFQTHDGMCFVLWNIQLWMASEISQYEETQAAISEVPPDR